eukprot:COSAG02_NODE_1071_length_14802_cov_5.546419_2_plen_92_part_00
MAPALLYTASDHMIAGCLLAMADLPPNNRFMGDAQIKRSVADLRKSFDETNFGHGIGVSQPNLRVIVPCTPFRAVRLSCHCYSNSTMTYPY